MEGFNNMSTRRLFSLIGIALVIAAALAACGKLSSVSYNSLSENPPSDLSAKATSSSSAHLEWKPPLSGVSIGYYIYRSDSGSAYAKIDTLDISNSIDNSIVNSPFYDDNGLVNSTSYCYEVSSFDSSNTESKKSNSACIKTPESVITAPADMSAGIGLDNSVSVTFTDVINSSTMDEDDFKVIVNSGADIGTPVPGSVRLENASTLIFTPDGPLSNGTWYEATVSNGVMFDDGSHLRDTYSWRFTTAP